MQGWESAPPLVQACLESWQRRNPTWTVRALTEETLSDYLDFSAVYPDVKTASMPAAALSDMVRVALLAEHGGVWADSTVFCATPLDEWIDDCSTTGFFAFARPGPDRLLSSWFLASEPDHPLTVEWQERVREYWQDRDAPDHYFWLHRLFSAAYRSQDSFRRIWDATPKIRSDGPHYFVPYDSRLAGRMTARARARVLSGADYVYKLSHRAHPAHARPGTAYEFFCRWAGAPVPAPGDAGTVDRPLLLALDRAAERVRWTGRHAGTGVRTAVVEVLRNAGVRRPPEGLTKWEQLAYLLHHRSR
jgi:Capsular polysaccharide synthesis protein